MQAEPKNRKECEIAIIPPLQPQLLIKLIIKVRNRCVLHMLPLLLHKPLNHVEGIMLKDDVQDLTLNEKFEVDEGVELVADLLPCLNYRVDVFIGTDVVFLIGVVLDIAHCIYTDLYFYRSFV